MKEKTITISIDEVKFQLKRYHDFQWLRNLGNVFTVFSEQDSGNICFGVECDGKKKFVKYAGAPTKEYNGDPKKAIERLIQAIPLYKELHHPGLIELIGHFEVKSGYVAIFEWFDGECLHSHWSFAGWNKYNHPDSPFYRYKSLPLQRRLESFEIILAFHQLIESKGYVAIDFYDGSILYNFKDNTTKICDIDFYRKRPTFNDIGQNFWGSSRSKSPEEYQLHAAIDERTNVFNMGAIAFGLFGGELDRSFSLWDAGDQLYNVALRAVENEREKRYSSVLEFYMEWKKARVYVAEPPGPMVL
ncbi:serine/threonine protein kinase [Paenibacillus sp. FA6]|uniref:serine/threonine protein kinase n=1 Tax=Paenibacillus sp. FA6 TaxID=3413029 RepID=UPI003F65F36F